MSECDECVRIDEEEKRRERREKRKSVGRKKKEKKKRAVLCSIKQEAHPGLTRASNQQYYVE